MPNRPRPRPAPQAFDVFKPGKGKPSPTSRPVIVSDKPKVQDSTLVEQHGSPVPNAHHGQQPVLGSLATRRVAQSAHAVHLATVPTPPPASVPEPAKPEVTSEPTPAKKISHTGHIMSRPSGAMASRHASLMHHKIAPSKARVTSPEEPEKKEEPSLAAVPITPVEQPAGLANAKTEGKEELLAAMPVEIRRSVANATGQTAADWDMPAESSAPAAPAAVAASTPPSSVSIPITDAAQSQPAAQPPVPAQTPQPAANQATQTVQQAEVDPQMPIMKTDKKRYSDVIIFIIMMVLFLGLGTVVAMLFITGTVSL